MLEGNKLILDNKSLRIGKIHFYKNDEIIATFESGLQIKGMSTYLNDRLKIDIEIKKAIKENLNRKDNFYIKTSDPNWYGDSYNLYIYTGGNTILEAPTEYVDMETVRKIHYKNKYQLKHNNKTYTIVSSYFTRTELTPFGKRCEELEKQFKDLGLRGPTIYDIEIILKHFDVTKK